jgi:hypothetical protein
MFVDGVVRHAKGDGLPTPAVFANMANLFAPLLREASWSAVASEARHRFRERIDFRTSNTLRKRCRHPLRGFATALQDASRQAIQLGEACLHPLVGNGEAMAALSLHLKDDAEAVA